MAEGLDNLGGFEEEEEDMMAVGAEQHANDHAMQDNTDGFDEV